MAEDTYQFINLSFLESFTGGNKEKMTKYINMFLQICPGAIEKIQTDLQGGNYDGVRATAHSLKPQITYMGIKGGDVLVKTIEQYAGEKINTDHLPALVSDFKNLCTSAMEELKKATA